MQRDTAIVFDYRATNIRFIAIDTRSNIIASESSPNTTRPGTIAGTVSNKAAE